VLPTQVDLPPGNGRGIHVFRVDRETVRPRADHVTVFRADAKTGGLASTGQYTPAGNPSHIAFVDLA
jgi:hypothetical protein